MMTTTKYILFSSLVLFVISFLFLAATIHGGITTQLALRQQTQQKQQEVLSLRRFSRSEQQPISAAESIESLRDLADKNQLQFRNLSTNAEQKEYQLGIAGGYLSFLNFLRATLSQEIPLRLDQVDISIQNDRQINILTTWRL